MNVSFLSAIHADPWSTEFVDLPALNGGASDAVVRCLEGVRDAAQRTSGELPSACIAILGPAGAGKTHLFSRLRRRLGPQAVFVYLRPLVSAEITPRFILHETVSQLRFATDDVPQVEALVGSLLGHLAGMPARYPRTVLEELKSLSSDARETRIEKAIDALTERWEGIDEVYLRRLLVVPFAPLATQRALLAWLSGRECDEVQLRRIGASAPMPEELILSSLRTLATVAATGAPLALVFDQLENLIDQRTSSRLEAYLRMATELVDAVRGFTVVQMALDTEWDRAIEPAMNLPQRSRLSLQRETLRLPTATEREALLRTWVERLPERVAPFPWPFGSSRVERLCRAPGITPRMLLIELRTSLEQGTDRAEGVESAAVSATTELGGEGIKIEALVAAWDEHLVDARHALDVSGSENRCVDGPRLLDGILAACRFVAAIRTDVARANEGAQTVVVTPAGNVNIALLHQSHPGSLAASLTRLAGIAERERVVAFRERAFDFKPTWKTVLSRQESFLTAPQASLQFLERDDVVQLLALCGLVQAARSRDVTDSLGRPLEERVVHEWIERTLAVAEWAPIRAILGCEEGVVRGPSPLLPGSNPVETAVRKGDAPVATPLVWAALTRLRVVSIERLIREVRRSDPEANRSRVLNELAHAGLRVRWFGSSIVSIVEER